VNGRGTKSALQFNGAKFMSYGGHFVLCSETPNVNYSGRTAPLTSKVAFYIFIQQIQVLNILNVVHTFRLSFFKMQFVS